MAEKYVFLDRDGVINKDGAGVTEYGYITRWEDFHFIPGVLDAIRKLNRNGFKCVIISNQQCVAKNICSKEDILKLTDKMTSEIRDHGGDIAGVYYCFHHKTEDCRCRKPRAGLFETAKKELDIKSTADMFFVGDTERDIKSGRTAGMKTILVMSGKTKAGDDGEWEAKPGYICKDLLEAVDIIVREMCE